MEKIITLGNVRESTSKESNLKIDQETFESIKYYSKLTEPEITQRIAELNKEWDIERVLEINLSALALSGIALSFKNSKWLALPAVVLGFFAQHAVQGWCPPVKLLRYLKVRTRDEIEQEKNALKALRGDFLGISSAEQAFMAVKD